PVDVHVRVVDRKGHSEFVARFREREGRRLARVVRVDELYCRGDTGDDVYGNRAAAGDAEVDARGDDVRDGLWRAQTRVAAGQRRNQRIEVQAEGQSPGQRNPVAEVQRPLAE